MEKQYLNWLTDGKTPEQLLKEIECALDDIQYLVQSTLGSPKSPVEDTHASMIEACVFILSEVYGMKKEEIESLPFVELKDLLEKATGLRC